MSMKHIHTFQENSESFKMRYWSLSYPKNYGNETIADAEKIPKKVTWAYTMVWQGGGSFRHLGNLELAQTFSKHAFIYKLNVSDLLGPMDDFNMVFGYCLLVCRA